MPGGSLLLCAASAFVFLFQPDVCAAVVILPRWLWILPGLVLALLGWTRERKRLAQAALILWLLYTLLFVQELRSLVRFGSSGPNDGTKLRIVSLNCNGGNEAAGTEVAAFHPDLVLFEETPLRTAVRKMATALVGPEAQSLCSSDVSLVARGKVTPVPVPNGVSAPFIHARVEFASGPVAEVFAVRLQPYFIRGDLWSPECWRDQYQVRRKQREQFKWVEREIEKVPPGVPIIFGGDFNLPAGDKLFNILKPRARDTFRDAGRGWGDTLDNDIPFVRIDQIWCSEQFVAASTAAHKTVNSDHRMVVCDLLIKN